MVLSHLDGTGGGIALTFLLSYPAPFGGDSSNRLQSIIIEYLNSQSQTVGSRPIALGVQERNLRNSLLIREIGDMRMSDNALMSFT